MVRLPIEVPDRLHIFNQFVIQTPERDGLKHFVQRWSEADVLHGKPVTVTGPDGATKGVARGIDLEGALLVETPGGLLRFLSGDVSVRADT